MVEANTSFFSNELMQGAELDFANPHAVTSILKIDGTTKNFSYDANGNVKSDGTLTLTWDYKNRMLSSKVGTTTTTYAYNATDARVSKATGGTTTYYPSREYSVKGSTTTVHIGGVATVDTTSGVSTTRTNHGDHLGSTSIVTDSAGVMVQLLDYFLTYRSDLGTYIYAGSTSTVPATRYANPHAVTSILKTDGTTKNFSYDANGNVKTDGTLTLTWDYKNRLATSRVGVTTTTYVYNS